MYISILFNVIILLYVFTITILLVKNKIFLKGITINGLLGIIVLLALKLFESFLKIKVYINTITVLSAVLLGPLGVVFNLFIEYFLKCPFFRT